MSVVPVGDNDPFEFARHAVRAYAWWFQPAGVGRTDTGSASVWVDCGGPSDDPTGGGGHRLHDNCAYVKPATRQCRSMEDE